MEEAGRMITGFGQGAGVGEAGRRPFEEGAAVGVAGGEEEVFFVTRDPRDMSFIRRLLLAVAAMLLVILVLATGVVVLSLRRPERTVIVKDAAGNVQQIDSQRLGGDAGLRVEEDAADRGDMIFLGRELARLMHEVDMKRRKFDLQRIVNAMTPGAADQYAKIMTERGILRLQKEEAWDATWHEQDFSLDPSDRSGMTVEVIGTQNVQHTVGGAERKDEYQYSLKFKMAVDKNGRQDYNLRSGFVVREFQLKPINEVKTGEVKAR